jgi:WD40 repeat protein
MIGSVKIESFKKQLKLVPDASPQFKAENVSSEREFELVVTNASDGFASFQIELWANGTEKHPDVQWYEVEPAICAKKPPGDRTTFRVVITKAPIPAYDVNVELTVRVFSVEVDQLFAETMMLLSITHPQRSMTLSLPSQEFSVRPGSRFAIPVLIHNHSPRSKTLTIRLLELDATWFGQGIAEKIRLGAGESEKVAFNGIIPHSSDTLSRQHGFTIEAIESTIEGVSAEEQAIYNSANSVSITGSLEVLPYGSVLFDCEKPLQQISPKKLFWGKDSACYELQFKNQSGSPLQLNLEVLEANQKRFKAVLPPPLELQPAEEQKIPLQIYKACPLLGREQRLFLQVIPNLVHLASGNLGETIAPNPMTRTLELRVRPVIPFWLQLIGGLIGLFALFLLYLDSQSHRASVNSVRLISNSSTVVSGSSDQTIQRWQVLNWLGIRLWNQGPIASDIKKSVRVIREIPDHEGLIAAGLENGNIQIWRISPSELISFPFQQSDRVFDLAFTQDSQYLFSAHGSGIVRQWEIEADLSPSPGEKLKPDVPIKAISLPNTTISALAVSGRGEQTWVAIAGQFNRLALWSPTGKTGKGTENITVFNYQWNNLETQTSAFEPVSSQYDYITSLAIAKGKADVLVTSDNRGLITTWSLPALQSCAKSNPSQKTVTDTFKNKIKSISCERALLQQWNAGGDNHQSINAIAITQDGRYLASVGDDGRVQLWKLESGANPTSTLVNSWGTRLKSVDIQRTADRQVLITSDAPQNQIKLYPVSVEDEAHDRQ